GCRVSWHEKGIRLRGGPNGTGSPRRNPRSEATPRRGWNRARQAGQCNVRILADGSFLLCYPDCWGPPLYDCLLVPAPGTAPATSDSKAATNPALTAAAVAESSSSIGLLSRMRYRLRHAVTAVLRLFG